MSIEIVPLASLQDILSHKTATALRELAKSFKIKGYTKMSKAELGDAVSFALQEPKRLAEFLYVVDDQTWMLFQRVAKSDRPVLVKNLFSSQYELLVELCYLQCIESAKGRLLTMPAEIKAVFDQLLEDGFLERKARYDLIHQYAMAAINLYGVISQEDFTEIFNQQNVKKTSEAEYFPILIRHIAAGAPYCFWDEYLVCDEFEENDFRDVGDLLAQIGNKPRYIPEMKEFLRYADWDYYEETEYSKRLKRYLCYVLGLASADVDDIMLEIHLAIAVESGIQQILDILLAYDVVFNEQQLSDLSYLIMEMSNHTRLWSNNGHTPQEMLNFFPQPLKVDPSKQKIREKIGRNDPCPCGSGKKYKKCCGR